MNYQQDTFNKRRQQELRKKIPTNLNNFCFLTTDKQCIYPDQAQKGACDGCSVYHQMNIPS